MKTVLFGMVLGLLSACLNNASAAVIQWASNGHYYEVVNGPGSWDSARTAAAAMSYGGVNGHLVTITSAQENQWLTTTFGATQLHTHWIGAVQTAGSIEPSGGWAWITGEPWGFTNWWGSEPNNFGGNEDVMLFDHGVTANGKGWNDITRNVGFASGFVVEYDVPIQNVPEPATLGMFLIGCGCLAGRRRGTIWINRRLSMK